MIISSKYHCNKLSAQFWQNVLVGYDEVNSYWVYSSLTKRVKIYCDVEFHKYKIIYNNTDISNEFQYAEFDEYEESETVEINILKSINQNTFTEFNIEPFTEVQDIDSHDVSLEFMNTDIISCCSECNWQPICH